jgi:hypothetical protein
LQQNFKKADKKMGRKLAERKKSLPEKDLSS